MNLLRTNRNETTKVTEQITTTEPSPELQGSNPDGKGDAIKLPEVVAQLPMIDEEEEPVVQETEEPTPTPPDELAGEPVVEEEVPPLVMEDGSLRKDLPPSGPVPEGPVVIAGSDEMQIADAELPDESGYGEESQFQTATQTGSWNRKRGKAKCPAGFLLNSDNECAKTTVLSGGSPKYDVPPEKAHCVIGTVRTFWTKGPNGNRRLVHQTCRM